MRQRDKWIQVKEQKEQERELQVLRDEVMNPDPKSIAGPSVPQHRINRMLANQAEIWAREDSFSVSRLRLHDKHAFDKDYQLFCLREGSTIDYYDALKSSGE